MSPKVEKRRPEHLLETRTRNFLTLPSPSFKEVLCQPSQACDRQGQGGCVLPYLCRKTSPTLRSLTTMGSSFSLIDYCQIIQIKTQI